MNKTWIFATMALALGTSCSKDKGIDIDDSSSQEILLGTGSTVSVSRASRGYGAVGGADAETNKWNGETLYVYGITDNADNKAPINGVKAVAPKGAVTGNLTWAENEPVKHFYYEGNDKYNFYAVHVDGAAGDGADLTVQDPKSLASTGHSVNVTIDGTQDLMVAMPNKDKDILEEGGENNLPGIENTNNLYSAWSARRGVVPNLVFNHLLSRLNFKAYCGAPLPEDGSELKITSITIKNTINKGSIVVIPTYSDPATEPVAENQKFIPSEEEGNTGNFVVMKKKAEGETELKPFEAFQLTGTAQEVGEDVLVVPDGSYDIEVTTVQNINGVQKTKTLNKTLTAGMIEKDEQSAGLQKFVAGEMYDVTLILYANQEIQIKCTLTAWKEGGEATLDEETIEY